MKFEQTTDRLILRILPADYAHQVLQFYKNNAGIFEQYEPFIDENFYTLEHQKHILTYEYGEILKLHMLRFWIYEKEHPDEIIGTISFHDISPNIYASAQLGYKMDQYHMRKGYCYEAIATGMHLLSNDIGIRRYEALVLPDNTPSIRLLEKIGFRQEGLLKDKVFLQNKWRDHYLYGYIVPQKQHKGE